MKRVFIILLLLPVMYVSQAQYISRIHTYIPAPGQFINAAPWGWPVSAESIKDDLNGAVSLGAYGGYVVFSFEEAVENTPANPFGVDFTIFGNAIPGVSEPGIVWVMKDENNNLIPDDTWYELAGSDYYFSGSRRNYEVTYFNPMQATATDVPWNDNSGEAGFIYANTFHTQPYYPLTDSFYFVNEVQFTCYGSFVPQLIDSTDISIIRNPSRAFGYADNHTRGTGPYDIPDNPYTRETENSGGDAFDISWAVDTAGNYVNLNEIHFIKVQTGCLGKHPLMGEISTEISGAVDIAPNSNIQGPMETIVIKHLPMPLKEKEHQLEAVYFSMGRPVANYDLSWSVDMPEAFVDENNVLHVSKSGELQLTATLVQDTSVKTTTSTRVELQESGLFELDHKQAHLVYPNPAKDQIRIKESGIDEIQIMNSHGQVIIRKKFIGEAINIQWLPPGFYILKTRKDDRIRLSKFIKQ